MENIPTFSELYEAVKSLLFGDNLEKFLLLLVEVNPLKAKAIACWKEEGDKIKAIKRYRAETGAILYDAKEAIEAVM